MKKYILALTLCVAVFMFLPLTAEAQSSDFGSGGSTSIIGLPSGRAYFQDATSQAQSGSYNNPAGGSNLLQENKSALLIVDSPLSSATPSTEPEVSSANIWWAIILAVAALFSLAGIAVVLMPRRLWQTEGAEDGEVAEEAQPNQVPGAPVTAEEVTAAEPENSEAPALVAPVVTEAEIQQSQAMAEEVVQAVSEGGELNKVQVVEIETEEEAEQASKKPAKKRKHGGRPTKKSRK